ncbi:hypothetical protein MVES_000713 [Malassezia vespertilionis]|uniref:Fe2OG dioxygenase domain-containing protein n=1 Tax=Malassezia vespertilionis TaxID=2020962 RepID=A0A2N1JGD5_9BASI|nr:hypothetical protein MVES_000713 [Malassezia vespertilionis]
MALEPFRVPVPGWEGASGGFFYLPEFLSFSESDSIDAAPSLKWKQLAHRRLQSWGGQILERDGRLVPEPMPPFLTTHPRLLARIRDTTAFHDSIHKEPNHCLVNEYMAGQGIMPHNDGPTYFPAVATLSLGGHVLLDIYPWREAREAYPTTPLFSILQEPRSLLIIQGDAYRNYLHGIAERTQDDAPRMANVANSAQLSAPLNDLVDAARRGENVLCSRERRVSLTFRDVERVQRGLRIGR